MSIVQVNALNKEFRQNKRFGGTRRLAPSAFLLVRGTRHTDDITG